MLRQLPNKAPNKNKAHFILLIFAYIIRFFYLFIIVVSFFILKLFELLIIIYVSFSLCMGPQLMQRLKDNVNDN